MRYNLVGLAAIILWSTTIAVSRQVIEPLGALTAGAAINLVAGITGLAIMLARVGWKKMIKSCQLRFCLAGGGLVVIYMVSLYLGLGWAETREQVIGIGLVNYLWPAFTQVFAIPLLGKRARWTLPVGIALALTGAWLASTGGKVDILSSAARPAPYFIMLLGAFSWALYSNVSSRWGGASGGMVIPFFLTAGGSVLLALRLLSHETSSWSLPVSLAVIYMGLLPGLLAYTLWELAVRRGSLVLVSSLSYLAPVLSTLVSIVVLGVPLTWTIGLAAVLVVAGAVVCQGSLLEPIRQ